MNSANGCFSLGFAYRLGNGVARNEALGTSLMDKGCDMGSSGCKFLMERGLLPPRAAAPASARPSPTPAERAAPAAKPPAPAPNAASARQVPPVAPGSALAQGIANSGVNFGASIATVRQSLAGRTVEILPARHNGDWYRLVVGGNSSDLDPRLVRLTYEFDAPESPAAKLIGVVLTYPRDGAAQSAVYSERVSTLSKLYPLAPQSPTKMEANVSGTVVSVIDDAVWVQVYEIYRKAGAFSAPTVSSVAEAGPPARNNCQAVTVTSSAIAKGDTDVTFTASPAIEKLGYNWTVNAGTINYGQGTPSITVYHPISSEEPVTATVILEADPSCPNRVRAASATATMP